MSGCFYRWNKVQQTQKDDTRPWCNAAHYPWYVSEWVRDTVQEKKHLSVWLQNENQDEDSSSPHPKFWMEFCFVFFNSLVTPAVKRLKARTRWCENYKFTMTPHPSLDCKFIIIMCSNAFPKFYLNLNLVGWVLSLGSQHYNKQCAWSLQCCKWKLPNFEVCFFHLPLKATSQLFFHNVWVLPAVQKCLLYQRHAAFIPSDKVNLRIISYELVRYSAGVREAWSW